MGIAPMTPPPYFTIFIVGHVIIPLMYFVERSYAPELWIHITLFGAIAIITSLISLPITKGGIVGLQWALRLHGFGETGEDQSRQTMRPKRLRGAS